MALRIFNLIITWRSVDDLVPCSCCASDPICTSLHGNVLREVPKLMMPSLVLCWQYSALKNGVCVVSSAFCVTILIKRT
jgi:hypothetical protein